MRDPVVIDERWVLGPLLGTGGSGRVWRATDRVTGEEVALKMVRVVSAAHRLRVAREIRAMQALQIAGVVQLRAVGEHGGDPFLVMELLGGSRFPGASATGGWRAIAQPFIALLQVLAQVHAAGFVHRDLKPDNALVSADGHVTLLDFGLAREMVGEASVTGDGGGPLGTPGYLAPEQLLGLKADARADLFAVGVMLFEALTGRLPHDDANFWAQVTSRRVPRCPPLATVVPGVDPALAAAVDALLAIEPAGRPANAPAALALLRGVDEAETVGRPVQLPFLGREVELRALMDSARRGRSRDLWGAPGSGRRRLLHEVAHRLGAEGVEVAWPRSGVRPLSSLLDLLGAPTGEDAMRELGARLQDRMATGLVLAVDQPAALDLHSRELIEAARSWGSVLRIADGTEAIHLEPLTPEALRPLFHGPDRVFHLREDAAEELHVRVGGLPERVAGELQGWITARLCAWDAGRVRIDRVALDRLQAGLRVGSGIAWSPGPPAPVDPEGGELLAWIVVGAGSLDVAALARLVGRPTWEVRTRVQVMERASVVRQRPDGRLDAMMVSAEHTELDEAALTERHRAVATVLPYGSEERLRQWLMAGAEERVAEEATAVAESLSVTGRAARASATLAAAWPATRALSTSHRYAFAQAWASCAIDAGDVAAAADALTSRATFAEPKVRAVGELLQACRDAASGLAHDAAERAETLGPFDHPELELHRVSLWIRAAVERGASIEPILAENPPADSTLVAERHAGWRGLAAYQRGDFAAAAASHARAATLSASPRRRLVAVVNEASARLDIDDVAGARALVDSLVAEAEARRFADIEDWAYGLLRTAEYRAGRELQPEPEWVEVSRAVGPLQRHAHACLIEAAVRWRRGQGVEAAELAAESAFAFRKVARNDLGVLPEALRRLNGGELPAGDDAAFVAEVAARRSPRFAEQAARILEALSRVGGDLPGASADLWRRERAGALRRDVLAIE